MQNSRRKTGHSVKTSQEHHKSVKNRFKKFSLYLKAEKNLDKDQKHEQYDA